MGALGGQSYGPTSVKDVLFARWEGRSLRSASSFLRVVRSVLVLSRGSAGVAALLAGRSTGLHVRYTTERLAVVVGVLKLLNDGSQSGVDQVRQRLDARLGDVGTEAATP